MTSASTRVWVIGLISWDVVLHVAEFPRRGGFTAKLRRVERPGGTAANVAQAVATAGVETGFVTVLGSDDVGRRLRDTLEASDLAHLSIRTVEGESSQVLILVDGDGDRTIIGLAGDELDSVHLDDVVLNSGDIVVFVAWDPAFLPDLERATRAGCLTIVGLGALLDPAEPRADLAFGSQSDVPPGTDPRRYLDRFDAIVMTKGEEGSAHYTAGSVTEHPARRADVVDTTGAGDAFLAGFLAMYAHGSRDASACLDAGAHWAAQMVAIEASIPPAWDSLHGMPSLPRP